MGSDWNPVWDPIGIRFGIRSESGLGSDRNPVWDPIEIRFGIRSKSGFGSDRNPSVGSESVLTKDTGGSDASVHRSKLGRIERAMMAHIQYSSLEDAENHR